MTTMQLSVEVSIPDDVDMEGLVAIGTKYAPREGDWSSMPLEEALMWALNDHEGCAELAALGVTWQSIPVGNAA